MECVRKIVKFVGIFRFYFFCLDLSTSYCLQASTFIQILRNVWARQHMMMMNYLKRRFSSNDLQTEIDNEMYQNSEMNSRAGTNTDSKILNSRTSLQVDGMSSSMPRSLSRNFSLTDSVINVARNIWSAPTTSSTQHPTYTINGNSNRKTKKKTLLIVDDQHVDWRKYFLRHRLSNDYEIHVEQVWILTSHEIFSMK